MRTMTLALGAALLVAVIPATATAYEHTTTCKLPGDTIRGGTPLCGAGEDPINLHWTTPCVNYHINELGTSDVDNEKAFEAIVAGFSAWNGPACSYLTLNHAGFTNDATTGHFSDRENANIVVFRDSGWSYDSRALAVTLVIYDANGKIHGADMELNSQGYKFTTVDPPSQPTPCRTDSGCAAGELCNLAADSTGTVIGTCSAVYADIANTVTHEAGHFIGIEHNCNMEVDSNGNSTCTSDVNATMFPSAPFGEVHKRTLAADDEAVVCETYPVDLDPGGQCAGPAVPFFEGTPVSASGGSSGGCHIAPAHDSTSPAWALWLVGLAAFGWRRKKA